MSEHVSASQFDTFFTCAEAYRRRYECGDKIPPGVAAVAGRSFHAVPEMTYLEVINGRDHLSVSDCQELAAAVYQKELRKDGVFMTREESQKKDLILGEYLDKSVRSAKLFREKVALKFDPQVVEHKFTVIIPGVWKPVVGIIDLLTTDFRLPDWKLSLAFSQAKADQTFQATIYWESVRQQSGAPPKETSFQVFKARKTKVEHQEFITHRDKSDVEALVNWSRIMERQIKAGNYPGCAPGYWKCSPKWCGYYPTCKLVPERMKRLPNV